MPEGMPDMRTLTQIADDFRSLEERFGATAEGDAEALAPIGGDLEGLFGEIPSDWPALSQLTMLCLEALQALYLGSAPDASEARTATRRALGAVERCLRSGRYHSLGPVRASGQGLWKALGRAEDGSQWQGAPLEPVWPGSEAPRLHVDHHVVEAEELTNEAPEQAAEHHAPAPTPAPPVVEAVAPKAEPTPTPKPEPEPVVHEEAAPVEGADPEIVKEFLVESYENLDRLDQDLIALEKDPSDRDTISSIFRTIHTIKGTCGFLGFGRLEALTHAGENLLSLLRDGTLTLNGPITDALLAMIDAVRQILGVIGQTNAEGRGDYSALTERLTLLQTEPDAAPVALSASVAPAPARETVADEPAELEVAPAGEAALAESLDSNRHRPDTLAPVRGHIGDILVEQGYIQPGDLAHALEQQEAGDHRRLGEILSTMGLVTSDIVERALQLIGASSAARSSLTDASIRVDVGLLDNLMNQIGELVLARNQIVQLLQTSSADANLLLTVQRLNLITSELQEAVMKTRMQPVGNVWSKFPRVVRDLAQSCGKQVRLEMEGKDTDLDKTLIEAIKDPLTHLVRNSVDHGIEKPEARVAAGKPAEGVLLLRAYHEGGQVNIEITDDGGGIDTDRVKAKAIEKGILTREDALRMSERDLLLLIFQPGFSTAATVTNVSGRGVGMDVVKTNIEKIGGTIEIQSQRGKGTTMKVKIPLTLAIVPALLVLAGEERYAIPQVSLQELVRLEPEKASKAIEWIQGIPIYRLRGKLLPLIYLNKELSLSDDEGRERAVNIVVLQSNERQFGLVVEGITDTEEIVVKPLSQHLKNVDLFAGATIMGDGRIALILDVMALASRAHVLGDASQGRNRIELETREVASVDGVVQTLLLFQAGRVGRLAIPLSTVARLEELPVSSIERIGHREVVQYRGHIMPLVRIPDLLPELGPSEPLEAGLMQVVVVGDDGKAVGMVVDSILDIVEERLSYEEESDSPYLVGTALLQGRVTQILNTRAVAGLPQEEEYGNAAPILHLSAGGLSVRGDADPGAGSDPSATDDAGAAGGGDRGRADQSAGTDRNRNRPKKAAAPRRAA